MNGLHIRLLICLISCFCFLQTHAQKNRKLVTDPNVTPQDSALLHRQQVNKDFFNRITQFSQLSWVCVPYTDLGSDKKGYILSADIAPQFFIGGERMRFAIALTPRYKVRIFRDNKAAGDSSLPVRTPSFMPGGTVFIPIGLGDVDNVYRSMKYISISFFHHSNGQDQPTFKSPGVFNYATGNFSTNYVEIGYTRDWRKPSTNKSDKLQFYCDGSYKTGYTDFLVKGSFEQHLWTADEQKGTYSNTRLNAALSFIKVNNWRWTVKRKNTDSVQQVGSCYLKESYRIVGNVSMNIDKLQSPYNNFNRRINIEAGLYRRIAAGNTALFGMVGYYGNDPYNIYYSKHYAFVRVGLALGFFVETSKISQ